MGCSEGCSEGHFSERATSRKGIVPGGNRENRRGSSAAPHPERGRKNSPPRRGVAADMLAGWSLARPAGVPSREGGLPAVSLRSTVGYFLGCLRHRIERSQSAWQSGGIVPGGNRESSLGSSAATPPERAPQETFHPAKGWQMTQPRRSSRPRGRPPRICAWCPPCPRPMRGGCWRVF